MKSQFIGNNPDARKDWRQEEKGWQRTRWHQWLNGHEFEQTPGYSERYGSLACCSPLGPKELSTKEQLNSISNSNPQIIICLTLLWTFQDIPGADKIWFRLTIYYSLPLPRGKVVCSAPFECSIQIAKSQMWTFLYRTIKLFTGKM